MKDTLVLILVISLYIFPWQLVNAAQIEPISADSVTVSAYIGAGKPEYIFSIFGYSSPHAKVSITNPGMHSDTKADDTGYFEFKNLFITLTIEEDLCLIAQDESQRSTTPVCIPPIANTKDARIGPIIMPPTISLNSDTFFVGDKIVVSGQTIPNTDVKLSMFTDESKYNKKQAFSLISPVNAATLPTSQLKTGKNGTYSYTISSSDPQFYRTFAQATYASVFSPKSNTLGFDILPYWIMFIKYLVSFLSALKDHIFELVILAQIIGIIVYIIRKYLSPHKIAANRALMVRLRAPLVFSEHSLSLPEHALRRRE